jgi:hypothetical protein
VTGYGIAVTTAGSSSSRALQVGDVTTATVGSLVNGTQYSFVVTAQTSQGAGVASTSASGTPVAPPPVVTPPVVAPVACSQTLGSQSAIGVAETPDGKGYWIATSTVSWSPAGTPASWGMHLLALRSWR